MFYCRKYEKNQQLVAMSIKNIDFILLSQVWLDVNKKDQKILVPGYWVKNPLIAQQAMNKLFTTLAKL